jgi:hypothetical protein
MAAGIEDAEVRRRAMQDVRIGNSVTGFAIGMGGNAPNIQDRQPDRSTVFFLAGVGVACLLVSLPVIVWASAKTPTK